MVSWHNKTAYQKAIHKCNSTRKGYHLYNAMLKYGIDRFTIDVVKICESELEMYELEKQLIFNTTNPEYGYNNSTGGELSTKGRGQRNKEYPNVNRVEKRKPHSEEGKHDAKGRNMSIQVANSARLRRGKPTQQDACFFY